MYAYLVDRGVSIADIRQLTDRQIHELYFHPRDEHGNFKVEGVEQIETKDGKTVEVQEGTLEYELMVLESTFWAFNDRQRMTADQIKAKDAELDSLKKRLREKWQKPTP